MVALGCLLVVILPLAGLAMGLLIGSKVVAVWCALGGAASAIAVCSTAIYAVIKAGPRS
jgi:hypothetical protein